ncbi:hypothetical protein [Neokomagataea thailandica]|uniref:Uncharacterized protein n=1 Tax=Neokomagataea tanensis NBRC 106556 TaxID=1223519 RepID=A0ABQ0QJE5_9PROT|nr:MULTISPECIES: hypothetical protein [Neokomagataea]GBR46955.1 hypothetical protein AA106556_1286 [Neokomagataea tanensis NBRC 106556]
MLNILLICFVVIIWPTAYLLFFKDKLRPWLDNKLTKDELPKTTPEEFAAAYPFKDHQPPQSPQDKKGA